MSGHVGLAAFLLLLSVDLGCQGGSEQAALAPLGVSRGAAPVTTGAIAIGEQPAVRAHLDQAKIDAGEVALPDILAHGERLFHAAFNVLDGQGRPGSTGTGASRVPTQPAFVRTSAPEASSCVSCHSQPKPGGGQSVLSHCEIEYGPVQVQGGELEAFDTRVSDATGHGLRVLGGADVFLQRCRLLSNSMDGLRAEGGARVALRDCVLVGNGAAGVTNGNAAFAPVVDAPQCYWGDDLGPFDSSDDRETGGDFNVLARGQRVTDGVRYRPPLTLGRSLTGTLTADASSVQTAPVGSTLPAPLTVELRDRDGVALAGVEVHFLVIQGDAAVVEAQPVRTDSAGRARASVRLG